MEKRLNPPLPSPPFSHNNEEEEGSIFPLPRLKATV